MEAIKQWLQDWSDACEYAKECWPDFSTLPSIGLGEPYTALLSVAGLCILIWAWNERALRRDHARRLANPAPVGGESDAALGVMKADGSAERKLAA
ncbi:hypothetical protein V3H18_08735 [Methylocystis sp. 9N]|uniref:Uncharacterized protein n=1 Tax=Methylocystis borbori TaxID=3118750 RepID=A0ABU7XGV9_9HYPH